MRSVTLFLCGDVMTGRGVDQIMTHQSDPAIHEAWVRDAREYVALAEQLNGPIRCPVDAAYIWGDALQHLERRAPDVRVINLETSITTSDSHWPHKGIWYRMHPGNIDCLTRAAFDVCVLANNHVLDYGDLGLHETLATLADASLGSAGAGRDLVEAQRPAIVRTHDEGRAIVIAVCTDSSGVLPQWRASSDRAGVDLLPDLSDATADALAARVRRVKQAGDVAIVSIHWGSNWGYEVPDSHVRFAHRLVDAGVDVIHGHSSHHPRPIEVYRNRLVLYGCGDFIDDYEGIEGYEEFHDRLVLMYFPTLDAASGELTELVMTPLEIRRLRLQRASADETGWMQATLDRVSREYGSRTVHCADGSLSLRWNE